MRMRTVSVGMALVWSLTVGLGSVGCGGSQSGEKDAQPVTTAKHAPAFSAPDQTGKVRTLAEFAGKNVVLYFYPKDATPGCTKEACAFRDKWNDFEKAGTQVLGVSMDDVESHKKFADEEGLTFPLLADVDGKIAAAYNVPTTFGMAKRMTFIIDKHGIIRRIFPDVDPAVHADEVMQTLQELASVQPAAK